MLHHQPREEEHSFQGNQIRIARLLGFCSAFTQELAVTSPEKTSFPLSKVWLVVMLVKGLALQTFAVAPAESFNFVRLKPDRMRRRNKCLIELLSFASKI
jgi:hypothetical protein